MRFRKNFIAVKKKTYNQKQAVDRALQYILYLSETHEGKAHDKKGCKIEEYSFPEKFLLRYGLGYVGYNPEHVTIGKPHKNTKLKQLTEQ